MLKGTKLVRASTISHTPHHESAQDQDNSYSEWGFWGSVRRREKQLVEGEALQTDGRAGEQVGGGTEAAGQAQVCISGVCQYVCLHVAVGVP